MPSLLSRVSFIKTPTDLQAYTLLEVVITLGIISLLLGLAWPVFQPWNKRVQLQMELATIRGFAEEAQWLALSTRRRHRLVENADFVALQRSGDSGYETLDSQQLSPEIEVTATRWPSFSAFGFAQGGTITLRSGTHEGKIVVNPIGRIRITGPNTAR